MDPILDRFLRGFGLRADKEPRELLVDIARAFSNIPYENLTKIIRDDEHHHSVRALRQPDEVIEGYVHTGTGGTCFSLTAALLHLLRSLGWEAEPIMADRPYGADTHCALVIRLDGRPHLIDPGYLLTEPIPVDAEGERQIQTAFNRILLTPRDRGSKMELSTVTPQVKQLRLTYKTSPVDEGEFRRLWNTSFDWEMMRYPLLTKIRGSKQIYLRGNYLQIRDAASVQKKEIPPEQMVECIASEFNLAHAVAAGALSILYRKGELFGQSSGR